ncbi:MAG TPA: DNA topoisomerase, partial [Erythrobacter sp.]|nr:DNA topoisomerase [Erythrobacter sp.]
AVRVGNEGYARTNKSFGATTLRNRHAELTGKTLRLRYKGKGGKLREVTLSDGSLARVVRKMQDLPGQNLFKYIDDDGEQHAVGSSDVNAYLRE